jgi:hypothetical protein
MVIDFQDAFCTAPGVRITDEATWLQKYLPQRRKDDDDPVRERRLLPELPKLIAAQPLNNTKNLAQGSMKQLRSTGRQLAPSLLP